MVRELVNDPLNQRVLDPACGSGTFLTEVVDRYIRAARAAKRTPKEVLDGLVGAATGIDIHPVAVHLARAAWVLAARRAIRATVASGYQASISVPVYLGDALQLRFQTGNMFAQHDVTIQVGDEANTELLFPISLVERAADFDSLMDQVADAIESGEDPTYALDDNGISDPGERKVLEQTIAKLQALHLDGRDHIWAYYTRNLVRPVALSRTKVDIIIGNPPWINYNQTADVLRTESRRLSQDTYGIWAGGRYATHQDVAGLFYTRSVDLYLENDGIIGMVMPHSALQSGQYTKWRSGDWKAQRGGATLAADFTFKSAWDLEGLNPNDFFPVPACVVFAERAGIIGSARPLGGQVERWLGPTGSKDVSRDSTSIADTSGEMISPYGALARQGATIVPRCLFFVHETDSAASIQAGGTMTVTPRRGSQDKAPWKDLDLSTITGRAVETQHVFDVHLGETLVPYTTLRPLKAVLPVTPADAELVKDSSGHGGIGLGGLGQRMRRRWRTIRDIWDTNKMAANRLDLSGRLDFFGNLSAQLAWMQDPGDRPVRVIYAKSGRPTAAVLTDPSILVDHLLYWVLCGTIVEAFYLAAIINSDVLTGLVQGLMSKGQFGARDLHKQLWRLAIPKFDQESTLHVEVSQAGRVASIAAVNELAELDAKRNGVTVTIARRELRKWLRSSNEGAAVEEAVKRLLGI